MGEIGITHRDKALHNMNEILAIAGTTIVSGTRTSRVIDSSLDRLAADMITKRATRDTTGTTGLERRIDQCERKSIHHAVLLTMMEAFE